MGRHSYYSVAASDTWRQSTVLAHVPRIITATTLLICVWFTFFYALSLQRDNQALAYGSVKSATITASRIQDERRGSDSQKITFVFSNDEGKQVWGRSSRPEPSDATEQSKWDTGKSINIHYLSDANYFIGDDLQPDSFIAPFISSSVIPLLALGLILRPIRPTPRDKYEEDILNPARPEAVINFDHESGRAVISGSSDVRYKSYTSIATPQESIGYQVAAWIFGAVAMGTMLIFTTFAYPAEPYLTLLLPALSLSAFALSAAFVHMTRTKQKDSLGEERRKEIERRLLLIEIHRRQKGR